MRARADLNGDTFGQYARWFASYHALNSGQSAYLYSFSRQPASPTQTAGAYHAAEISFVFGDSILGPTVPEDHTLSEKMQRYWTAFATRGDPNAHSRSEMAFALHETWPQFSTTAGPPTMMVRRKISLAVSAGNALLLSWRV